MALRTQEDGGIWVITIFWSHVAPSQVMDMACI